MSRPLRIIYPGAFYHIMNRGAGYGEIFDNDLHRQIFLELLGELHETFKGIQPHREYADTPQKILDISIDKVIHAVAKVFGVKKTELFNVPRGRGQDNPARSAALYIARKTAGKPLSEIAEVFGLAHYGSVSGIINRFAKRIQQDKTLADMVRKAEKTIK